MGEIVTRFRLFFIVRILLCLKITQDSKDADEGHSSAHDDTFSHITRALCASSILQDSDSTPSRRFHFESEYGNRFSAENIEVPQGPWVFLACPESEQNCHPRVAHIDRIVIAINGACSNNGRPEAISSIGVYCGPENPFNLACTLNFRDRHTSQLAELEACAQALMKAVSIEAGRPFGDLNAIIIKSDSEYLVRGLTEWLPKWKQNGWKNCKGMPVANAIKFQMIEGLIKQLEQDVSVRFWLVPRKLNGEADSMAKFAIESDVRGSDILFHRTY